MKQIRIRDMGDPDIPAVAKIERMSFSTPWSEASFLNEIRKSRSIARVAVLDDTVVGYLCAEQILDECHVLTLAVTPDYRNMGIATSLVLNVMDELRRKACRFLYLEVRASNAVAKGLYEGLGFRTAGIRKKYYVAPDEDAAIMMMEL